MPSPEQMHMQVIDSLSAVRTGVNHQTIAIVEPLRSRDIAGGGQQPAKQRGILRQCMGMGTNMPLRNHKDVHRGLRMDVREGDRIGGLVQALNRDSAIHNLAEKTIGRALVGHGVSFAQIVEAAC